ncbi:MAG: hypothetical protein ACKOXO_05925 [Cyanobium sp.]
MPRLRQRFTVLLAAALAVSLALPLFPSTAAPATVPRSASAAGLLQRLPADLRPLVQELQRHGFRVMLARPPAAGVYGQFVAASRTLWLAPIAFELGIGRQTLLHEAVHALQSCPTGRLSPIGWRFRLEPVVQREIEGILHTRYHHGQRLLELEAFALQGQPDAAARLIAGLRQRCRRVAGSSG